MVYKAGSLSQPDVSSLFYEFVFMTQFKRPSGRSADALRAVNFQRHFTRHAEGSVLVEFGGTRVLCTASIEEGVPGFLRGRGQGWVTTEYGMLPRATHTRSPREAAKGKQSGRTQEIQRLIGRSLRAIIDLSALGERTVTLDCDVLQADGGTRTAAITGGYVALVDACNASKYSCGVYSSANNWNTLFGSTSYTYGSNLPAWYAHYDNDPSFNDWASHSFGGFKPWGKQYAGDTTLCGFGVDKNYVPSP